MLVKGDRGGGYAGTSIWVGQFGRHSDANL